jgi:hypothetical protein
MATPYIPPKAKLFIGILFEDEHILKTVIEILRKSFGSIDTISDKFSFFHTEYYSEIGNNLFRIFISFENLINRDEISSIKLLTNDIELKYSENEIRKINIDPGYMTLSNVFLASCKDFYHRVYIGNGVFIENEYQYTDGNFKFWEWTYPDYRQKEYTDYFMLIRDIYKKQLRVPLNTALKK